MRQRHLSLPPTPTPGMDQESGAAAPAGSFISLNEHEQRYYSGLHSLCQADASGTLSSGKVAELFKASQLPPDSLHKVTELCGAKRLGYFGTPQFFVALKLLAAAQSALPIHLESITANLPLPRFVGLKTEPEMRYSVVPPSVDGQGARSGTGPPGSGSWTPADRRHPEDHVDRKESWSPGSSPPRSPPPYRGSPYAEQSNGAEPLTAYESKPSSRLVQPDQRSSPGAYGTRAAAAERPARTSSSERLDQQGLVDGPEDDPWRITEEQLEYYTNQFQSLQPDLGALILGTIAKNFFTKSKLPIPELSHIWELSDVDRDGALTFSEFCTAFHLIVARKNGFPLPESLPPTLRTGSVQHEHEDTPESAAPLIVFEDAEPRPSLAVNYVISFRLLTGISEGGVPAGRLQGAATRCTRALYFLKCDNRSVIERLSAAEAEAKQESCERDVGVTTETASPEQRVLRLAAFPERTEPPQDLDPHMRTRTRPRSYSSTSIEDATKKAEEPPTPPPRPQKTHSRASSLDLNKLFQQGAPGMKSVWMPPPPALPPRPASSQVSQFIGVSEKTPQKKVQQPNFADFSHFRDEHVIGVPLSQAPQKPVRKKYHAESQNMEATPPPAAPFPTPTKQRLLSKQKREIQTAIRKNKETNAVLTRLNSELQQQLEVVHQERITLETQLELQRPLAST
ncbi:ralBP1-associated Eps domain-containing protein 2 [Lycodopsis pacificus]